MQTLTMLSEETLIKTANQLYEINKLAQRHNIEPAQRACRRIFNYWEEEGLLVHDPTGEAYNSSRTDCEANIAGQLADNLYITETIKPAIYLTNGANRDLMQRAVVVVEQKKQ